MLTKFKIGEKVTNSAGHGTIRSAMTLDGRICYDIEYFPGQQTIFLAYEEDLKPNKVKA